MGENLPRIGHCWSKLSPAWSASVCLGRAHKGTVGHGREPLIVGFGRAWLGTVGEHVGGGAFVDINFNCESLNLQMFLRIMKIFEKKTIASIPQSWNNLSFIIYHRCDKGMFGYPLIFSRDKDIR